LFFSGRTKITNQFMFISVSENHLQTRLKYGLHQKVVASLLTTIAEYLCKTYTSCWTLYLLNTFLFVKNDQLLDIVSAQHFLICNEWIKHFNVSEIKFYC